MELSFAEIVLICMIAFVVFGPEEFVRRSHQLGQFLGKMRNHFQNFRVMAEEEITKKEKSNKENSSKENLSRENLSDE